MAAYLGIDIGGTNVKAALVSEDGTLVSFLSRPWSGGEAAEAVAVAAELYRDLTEPEDAPAPVACGVGSAGLVNAESGTVRLSPNLPLWHDVELGRMLEEALGLPVLVDNDANSAAYAEYVLGAARGTTNAVVLTLGTGIGGGLILGGRLYRGRGFAGEIGHTAVDRNGPPCPCGSAGCLERLANAEAVIANVRRLLDEGRESPLAATLSSISARDVGEAAAAGDAVALEALQETGRGLGIGLANLVLLLDPDVIVLGGGVAAAGEPLFSAAREEMRRRVYGNRTALPELVPAELGDTAGVVGAALLARDELRSS